MMPEDGDPPGALSALTIFEAKILDALDRLEKDVATLQLQVEELALILQQGSPGTPAGNERTKSAARPSGRARTR
jgi:hypothetical protein